MKNKYLNILIVMLILSVGTTYAQSDSLSHYLKMAAENNPLLKSQFSTYKASLEKIPQAGAIPDPQLEMGFFITPMEVLDGKQIADFKLMQMFPWFGTRKAARSEAAEMARMNYEQFRETKDNLFFEIKSNWYTMANLNQQLYNIKENKSLLMVLKNLAITRFSAPSTSSSGASAPQRGANNSSPVTTGTTNTSMGGMGSSMQSTSQNTQSSSMSGNMTQNNRSMGSMDASQGGGKMSEVLRIELELNELENQQQLVESQMISTRAKFNALIGRETDSEITLPDSLTQLIFQWDDHTILQTIKSQNPMLSMAEAEEAAYNAKEVMDRRMGLPMIGIGIQYSLLGKRNDAMIPVSHMNGKDMIMPMVSLSIPIWRKKYKAAQNESRHMTQAAKDKYKDALNNLLAEQRSVKQQLLDAERNIKLYNNQTDLANITYDIAVKEFATGSSNLTNVLDIERQLLGYKLKKSEAIATYNTVVAMIENLLSEPQEEN